MIGLILCVWGFTVYGIPVAADIISETVPSFVTQTISQQALKMLDDDFFKPSGLESARAEHVKEIFTHLCREIQHGSVYKLKMRGSPIIGPNAFALPSGIIVITDELVNLAENDDEIRGVFVHEIAHVRNRHGIRSVLQSAGVFLIISIIAGDITSITSLAATLPTLLIESGYSRKFEKEADTEAGLYFIRKGLSTVAYQNILLRITKSADIHEGLSWISTHPEIQERINLLKSLEEEN